MRGVVYIEARLLLASNVTVPFNGLSSTNALSKTCDTRSCWLSQVIMTSLVGQLLIAKSNNNNVTLYNNQLFLPLIALSNAIKRITMLLTTNSSNNIFNKI